MPVLNRQLTDLTAKRREQLLEEFKNVIGAIIILAEPLSISSLASLLNLPEIIVQVRLDALHAVLNIPSHRDGAVHLLHLSFRDFLLDSQRKLSNPFWINEHERQRSLAIQCLGLLLDTNLLRKDICNLRHPGKKRTELDDQTIQACLPSELQYACRYWVYHLKKSKSCISDFNSQIHRFLEKRFLYWVEALSLIAKVSESVTMIVTLHRL